MIVPQFSGYPKVRKDVYIGPLNLPYAYTTIDSHFDALYPVGTGQV